MLATEKRGKLLARATVADTEAMLQAMDRLLILVHCDMVKLRGTWHPSGRWQAPARSPGPAAGQVGTGPAHGLIHSEDLFTIDHNSHTREHESWRSARIQARRSPAAKCSVSVDLCQATVPSEPSSVCLAEHLQRCFSQNFMWQLPNPSVTKLLYNVPATTLVQRPCSNIH
jgi:hypothetical protein